MYVGQPSFKVAPYQTVRQSAIALGCHGLIYIYTAKSERLTKSEHRISRSKNFLTLLI